MHYGLDNYLPEKEFEEYKKEIDSMNPFMKFLRKILLAIGSFKEYKLMPKGKPKPPEKQWKNIPKN